MDLYAVLEAVARTLSGVELARFSRICKDCNEVSAKLQPTLSNKIRFEIYAFHKLDPEYCEFNIIHERNYYVSEDFKHFTLKSANMKDDMVLSDLCDIVILPPGMKNLAEKYEITALSAIYRRGCWLRYENFRPTRDMSGFVLCDDLTTIIAFDTGQCILKLPWDGDNYTYMSEAAKSVDRFFKTKYKKDSLVIQIRDYLVMLIDYELHITDGKFTASIQPPKFGVIVDLWAVESGFQEIGIFLVYQAGFVLWTPSIKTPIWKVFLE